MKPTIKTGQLSNEQEYILDNILEELSKLSTNKDALSTLFVALGVISDASYKLDEIPLNTKLLEVEINKIRLTLSRSSYASIDETIEQKTANTTTNLVH